MGASHGPGYVAGVGRGVTGMALAWVGVVMMFTGWLWIVWRLNTVQP
jgi:hypothetical protein